MEDEKSIYFFCGLADNVRLVDVKMCTQSAYSAHVDICRIAKWLFFTKLWHQLHID